MVVLTAACSDPVAPIQVEEGSVTVQNQTSREWRNVRIVLNDHFSGGAAHLAAGGRLNAPLNRFTTAFGQPFESRDGVKKIEVTATDAAGETVTLRWPESSSR